MNAPTDLRLDKATFDRWLLDQERKYEWKDGRVVQMNNVTRGHARVVANILRALSTRLDPDAWAVVASDFGVEKDTFVRFPDVLVEPESAGPLALRRSESAILLFEVLSPSSVDTDMLEKPAEYRALDSLEAYVVASQDAAICWLWERDPVTGAFPAMPVRIAGRDQSIPLAKRGIAVPLAEIYRNIPTVDD
jgi:Uma2 family endonuclease